MSSISATLGNSFRILLLDIELCNICFKYSYTHDNTLEFPYSNREDECQSVLLMTIS